MPDKMKIEILEDGTISVTTEGISSTNHHSADQFLEEIKKISGGSTETTKTREGHVHNVAGKKIWHTH